MYTQFFNLKEKPFEIAPDPRFLYLSESHREGLAHLIYAVKERKGFTVITGEVGTGKTVLVQTLLGKLDGKTRTAYVFNPKLGPTDFLNYICEDLGLRGMKRYKGQTLNILQSFLLNCHSQNENVVLIIDEAQSLDPRLLEEVRLLSNFETSKGKLIQVIMIGQPELDETLNRHEFRQIKQRVSLRFNVQPLRKEETKEYINHRLRKAGGVDTDLFSPKALDRIYKYSQGIPRVVNIVCDNALLIGYATDEKIIGEKIIREAIENLEGPGFKERQRRFKTIRRVSIIFLGLTGIGSLVTYGILQNGGTEVLNWLREFGDAIGGVFNEVWEKLRGLV